MRPVSRSAFSVLVAVVIIIPGVVIANGYQQYHNNGHHNGHQSPRYAAPPQPQPSPQQQHQFQQFNPRSLPPPHPLNQIPSIIASYNKINRISPSQLQNRVSPAQYRTVNPTPPQQQQHPHHPHHRHQHPHHNHNHHNNNNYDSTAQLIASASNTPVLVLKKDHTRPLLASAVVAAAVQQKREQQQAKALSQAPTKIPTVMIESPRQQREQREQREQQKDPLIQSQSITIPTTSQPKKSQNPQQQQPKSPRYQEQQQQQRPQSVELEEEEEGQRHAAIPPTASAERRMFFESVAENSGLAQQVSGPQGRSQPQQSSRHSNKDKHQQIAAATSSTRHHQLFGEDDDDEVVRDEEQEQQVERITRSNNSPPHNPYAGNFEYPPNPQSNYIVSGPTRVPVKYQQGVVGIKPVGHQHLQKPPPHHHHPSHPHHQQQQQRPYKQRIQQAQQQSERGHYRNPQQQQLTSSEEEELELEEQNAQPDRLTELLATSKFTCGGKKDGYYADDSLNCEVFHYCQDGGKHSWLCPNGFAFHQIHLICVPPSSDNICKQSSNYHFVNEYLYKPINEREHEVHNASLKYADRYFPDGYNHGAGDVLLPYHDDEADDDDNRGRHHHHQQVARPQQHHHHQQAPPHNPYAHHPQQQPRPHHHPQAAGPRPSTISAAAPYNPYANHHHHPSPSSPRPASISSPSATPIGGFIPITHHQQPSPSSNRHHHHHPHHHPHHHHNHPHHHHHKQQVAQQRSSQSPLIMMPPTPKQSSSNKPPPNVFFTPESINIPLNQRRPIPNPHTPHLPQIFRPSKQLSDDSNNNIKIKDVAMTNASTKRKFEDVEEDYEY